MLAQWIWKLFKKKEKKKKKKKAFPGKDRRLWKCRTCCCLGYVSSKSAMVKLTRGPVGLDIYI